MTDALPGLPDMYLNRPSSTAGMPPDNGRQYFETCLREPNISLGALLHVIQRSFRQGSGGLKEVFGKKSGRHGHFTTSFVFVIVFFCVA